VLLVFFVLLTAFSPWFLPEGAAGKVVIVRTPGSSKEISLDTDGRYPVSGPLGTAYLVVEDGGAHLENSPCPLKICEATGTIDSSGEVIVCLPNRIVVKIPGPEVVDAVSR
jgi:hypothetical protein